MPRCGALLVAADIERADDEMVRLGGLRHLRVHVHLLVLARGFVLVEEKIFGAQQADALGAVLLDQRQVLENLDVGRDDDAALVERDRQRLAQRVELDLDVVVLLLALAVFVLRLLGRA